MSKLTTAQMQYLSDDMYLPIHYKVIKVEQPFYSGDGNHSVSQLETICRQFKEYCHQQSVIKQSCMKHIIELKYGVELSEG
jgi:hypothetical protein